MSRLHAIAITDHNTANWCDAMAAAADELSLVVLPGVELSTAEGHLLAIWEEGTPGQLIEDVLVELGVLRADHGDLHKALRTGFAHTAKVITARGGVAIAAHADREKGLLRIPVADHVNQTMLDPVIAAVEVVDIAEAEKIKTRLDGRHELAVVRSSDTTMPGSSVHVLQGIGNRRTWIKASRPDLRGLQYALDDPSLRVSQTRCRDSPRLAREPSIFARVERGGGEQWQKAAPVAEPVLRYLRREEHRNRPIHPYVPDRLKESQAAPDERYRDAEKHPA